MNGGEEGRGRGREERRGGEGENERKISPGHIVTLCTAMFIEARPTTCAYQERERWRRNVLERERIQEPDSTLLPLTRLFSQGGLG